MARKIVYVVSSSTAYGINERVKNLLLLREQFEKMVLICSGDNVFTDEAWEVKHSTNPTGVLRKLGFLSLKKLVDRWLYFPSTHILFVNAVYKRLRKQIRADVQGGIDVCLITCLPSHDLCLLGMKLKDKYPAMRWICDWQDLWSYDTYYLHRVPRLYQNRVRQIEKQALTTCDMNVTTNPFAKQVLEQSYQVSAERVRSIYHPFNDEDIADSGQEGTPYTREPGKPVRIVFLGNLFKPPKVPGDKVVEAIHYLRGRGIDVELHLFGKPPVGGSDKLAGSGVVLRGYLGSAEINSNIQQCDFLLLVLADLPNCRTIMHAKLPQYLLAKRPIIAIVPEVSAVAEIVKETRSGYVIPAGKNWGAALYRLFSDQLADTPPLERNQEAIERFSWHNLAKQWLEII